MQTSSTPSNIKKILAGTRSQFAEKLLVWEGKQFSLTDYPMFRAVYDASPQKMLLKTCRQVGKSMTLSTFAIGECLAIPHFKTFFIAPTKEQTQTFSVSRVGKFILFSPLVRDIFVDTDTTNRVLARYFSHGSQIEFSYASDDADRCRGRSCDRLMLDEVQDMSLDVILPVIKECLAASKRGSYETYCGTPKSMENGIEHLWEASSQTEWAVKCPGCGKHSILVSETQVGRRGPVCKNCDKYLNPREGVWVDMHRLPPDEDGQVYQTKGYHISRLIMPQYVPAAWPEGAQRDAALAKWKKDVLQNLEGSSAYPISVFRNEVLGISDSQGRRLVSREMLQVACDGPLISRTPTRENLNQVTKIAVGLDWSGGGTATTTGDGGVQIKSRTVMTIIGKMGLGRTRLLYFKIFPGTSPLSEFEEIFETLALYDRTTHFKMFIGGDAGEGNMSMDMLRNKIQNPQRVIKFRYSGNAAAYMSWNRKGKFVTVNRTISIDSLMTSFIRKEFQFPSEPSNVMDQPFKDIMAEYEEVIGQSGATRKVWRHAPNQPDDFLHSLNFARMALQIANNEINLTSSVDDD
jgi:hypothetical protein